MQDEFGDAIEITYFDGKSLRSTPPSGPKHSGRWNLATQLFWHLPDSTALWLRRLMQHRRERTLTRLLSPRSSGPSTKPSYDVYHEAGFYPFSCAKHLPTVFTVHDMSLFRHPEWHPKERVALANLYFEKRLQLADHIITVSRFTQQELQELLPATSQLPVTITHLGVSPESFHPHPALKEKVPDKYYLFVGSNDCRKQVDIAIQAVNENNDLPLLVAGWEGWGQPIEPSEKVIPLGYVSEEMLKELYCNAECLIYPSAYEGFGLPILEAMQCGCPVITTDQASMKEVGGNAAHYYAKETYTISRLEQIQQLKRALQALKEPAYRQRLSIMGKERAARFTWRETARKTYSVLQKAAEQNKKKDS